MPILTIDNRQIEVPEGTQVIEAAERLGIMIPRFCYHPALGAVGACRVCAVMFLDGPVKGVQMSCMTRAMDGMVVSTDHPDAVEFRRQVIEWLMVNHPHDCPVCDEGGQCLLQDLTIAGGHGRRRFGGPKRTHQDQDLGPLVQHEMNRCIHCYRCVRFYREYTGYRDLGALGIASRVYFGRFADGTLESPFSGNLIDICPTGVYTDKPARFKARHWDLERAPSVCLHCSLGCNTTAAGRYREVIRQEARSNDRVNGYFICDRGRFGFGYSNSEERPRLAAVNGRHVETNEALAEAAERLQHLAAAAGEQSIATLGSLRNTLETQLLLGYLSHNSGWRRPVFFTRDRHRRAVTDVMHRQDRRLAASLPDIEKCDLLVTVGLDPLNETPLLALAMRQAVRGGARAVVIDPRPVRLPFAFDQIAASPDDLEQTLAALIKLGLTGDNLQAHPPEIRGLCANLPVESPDDAITAQLRALAPLLAESHRPVILCGSRLGRESLPPLALDLALLLRRFKGEGHFFFDPGGPNALGAALLDEGDDSLETMLEAIEKGEIKGLLVTECDPGHDFPDRRRLEKALQRLDLLVVLDYLSTPTFHQAHIRLPTSTIFEAGGTFINHAGLAQHATAAIRGGLPLHQVGKGSHPPRIFDNTIPSGDQRSAYHTLLALGDHLGVRTPTADHSPWSLLPEDFPNAAGLHDAGYPANGLVVLPAPDATPALIPPVVRPSRQEADDALILLAVESTFGTEELSSRAEIIGRMTPGHRAWMHPDDAGRTGIKANGPVRVKIGDALVDLDLELTDRMARGCFIMERHHRLMDKISSWPRSIGMEDVEKQK